MEIQESPSSMLLVWVHYVQHDELNPSISPAVAAYSQKARSKCLLFSVSGMRESAWRCHRWQGRSSGVIVGKLICKHSSENLFPSVKGYFGTYLHETKTPSIKCHLVHQPNCLQASYSTKYPPEGAGFQPRQWYFSMCKGRYVNDFAFNLWFFLVEK